MEHAQLWLSIGMFVATAGAAAVAWWQAIEAGRRRSDAERASKDAAESRVAAVEAQQSAAQALAEANALAGEALAVQRAALPPAWGPVEIPNSNVLTFRNQSSRPIVVTDVGVAPDAAKPFVGTKSLPIRVDYGDVLVVQVSRRLAAPVPRDVTITWQFEDEPDGPAQVTTRQV